MATWPTTLPKPLRASWQLQPLAQTIRTDMDSGIGRVRRRTRAIIDTVNVEWAMSAAQLAEFRTWWENPAEGNGGVAWFDMPIQTGMEATCEQPRRARFVGQWAVQAFSGSKTHFRVNAILEVRQ